MVNKCAREYNVSVTILLLILGAVEVSEQASAPVRGDRFQIVVPQGWRVLNAGGDIVLEHSSGASLLLLRAILTGRLEDFAHSQAERVMAPLGFAKLGEPEHFKATNEEWVQYEIRGNRQSENSRIIYRVFRRSSALYSFY